MASSCRHAYPPTGKRDGAEHTRSHARPVGGPIIFLVNWEAFCIGEDAVVGILDPDYGAVTQWFEGLC